MSIYVFETHSRKHVNVNIFLPTPVLMGPPLLINHIHKKKKGIITANPPEVWPVYTLPTRGSKLITLPP